MRRTKNLGLVVMMTVALTAVLGATGASAAYYELESSPATVSSTGAYGEQFWNFNVASNYCEAQNLGGTVSNHSPAITASVQSSKCSSAFIGNELKANGCTYRYQPGAKTGAATFKGTVDILCPAGQAIEFTSASSQRCRISVPAQTGLAATFENVGSGKERAVRTNVSTSSLKYSQLSGTYCTVGSYTNGTWEGSWRVQASNGSGSVGMWLGFPSIGIIGTPPKLSSSYYPVKITGEQGTQHVLSIQAGNLKCNTANLSTSASEATAQLAVQAEYSGCTGFAFPATVNMNGCTYTFNILNQAPIGSARPGHADISCPEGKSIVVTAIAAGLVKCTVTIPAQTTDSGGLTFTNEPAIPSIGVALNMQGIDYHQQEGSGVGRCKTADATDGTYTGSSTLIGGY
ncbi:MAG TPA: hypothetical protein VD761_06295 [Solirubrobacterales bacterium]|nr:hypothetical protein [Solirubrobacterales bacterium]